MSINKDGYKGNSDAINKLIQTAWSGEGASKKKARNKLATIAGSIFTFLLTAYVIGSGAMRP